MTATAINGTATPTLSLSNGATATYTTFDAAGLHFSYTVQAGLAEDTSDLVATGLNLNGATVDHAASTGFATQTTYAVGSRPSSVTTADVNHDGKVDLLTQRTARRCRCCWATVTARSARRPPSRPAMPRSR